jgi:hypothetical protein
VAAFAELEKSLIASRLSAGDKALQLDGEKAAVVRRVFELRDALPNASLQKLAGTLNAEGRTTKEGKQFHPKQVKRILGRRSLCEGRYKYKDVEADGQHPAIID